MKHRVFLIVFSVCMSLCYGTLFAGYHDWQEISKRLSEERKLKLESSGRRDSTNSGKSTSGESTGSQPWYIQYAQEMRMPYYPLDARYAQPEESLPTANNIDDKERIETDSKKPPSDHPTLPAVSPNSANSASIDKNKPAIDRTNQQLETKLQTTSYSKTMLGLSTFCLASMIAGIHYFFDLKQIWQIIAQHTPRDLFSISLQEILYKKS